jgi:indole-3-glycerol phosphate synthase
MTILDEIVAKKRREIADLKKVVTAGELEKSDLFSREVISMKKSVLDEARSGIIAEFKRKSPSKGIINSDASVARVASGYFREGASGVSVLTEWYYFGGRPADLTIARTEGNFPLLRKDFIIDEYQVIESKSIGADAILLIAAALDKNRIRMLASLADSIGLEVLLEIHGTEELDMLNPYVDMIGVNNRNLKTFKVNTDVSLEISGSIPQEFVKISESGIASRSIMEELKHAGYNGFLIGEKFMSDSDPVKAFAGFVDSLK